MTKDIKLNEVTFISKPVLKSLGELEINTARQLFARLNSREQELKEYMQLSTKEYETLRRKLHSLISKKFPEDLVPRIHPRLNRRGVAVHRLHDTSRPRYYSRKASS